MVNLELRENEIIPAIIDSKRIAYIPSSSDYIAVKIKIIWKNLNFQKQRIKNIYGTCFVDLKNTKQELICDLLERLESKNKKCDNDIGKVVLDIDLFLDRFRKTE